MTRVGRNDPCPCGSGLKYKRCCLGKSTEPPGAYSSGERQAALDGLFRFAASGRFEQELEDADLVFWGDLADELSAEELREAMALEQSQLGFQEWYVFDFSLDAGTILDRYLAREGGRLRDGEVRFLERMRRSHIRPYEIVALRPEEGLDLIDLWARRRLRVRERLGTRQLAQWDVLAARIILGPRGEPVVEGSPYLYPPEAQADLLRLLKRGHRAFRKDFPRGAELAFFKDTVPVYHGLWLDLVALRPLPRLVTAEGDDIVLARVVFDVKDQPAVEAALADHPDLGRQDDGSYVWLEAGDAAHRARRRRGSKTVEVGSGEVGPRKEGRRSLGTVVPGERRLVFETTSRPRAERGRAMIEALAGGAVAYRAITYEDVEQAMKRLPDEAPRDSDISSDIAAELTAQFYEDHYRKWVDEPLPALGGRTPRAAARLGSARPKLIALLKSMENMSARQRRESQPTYNFGWMWGELGLERPG